MPRSRWGVAWRGLVAFVLVVGCAAGATATAGLLQIKSVVDVIDTQKAIASPQLTLPSPGAPETLLLVGVDHRYGQGGSAGNTDTMMLVRVNDSSATINTLSIPRDLAVNVPGYGMEKINAAYSEGGPSLLIKTLRADVFPNLRINHLLLVDFASFANLINAIGCVYVQSDQRYYNHSIGAADPTTDYSSIDIQPGYQRLCGGSGSNLGGANTALAFVRFRHNDSDFVRQARQQDFLRWAKQGFSASELLSRRNQLLHDFAKDVQSDGGLHTMDGLIELFNLAINADGSSQKSIPFPYTGTAIINGADDVTFSETAAEQAYHEFMTPTRQAARTHTTPAPVTTTPASGGHHRGGRAPRFTVPAGMTADTADGRSQAAQLQGAHLPVYYPRYIPGGFGYCYSVTGNCDVGYEPASAYAQSYPRSYRIDGFGGKRYPSYVMTITGQLAGEYATIEGTTWPGAGHAAGPPILRTPTLVKVVDHRRLYLYSQGGALTVVAWKTPGAVYWVSNTLQNQIPNDQMVAMAATFTRARP